VPPYFLYPAVISGSAETFWLDIQSTGYFRHKYEIEGSLLAKLPGEWFRHLLPQFLCHLVKIEFRAYDSFSLNPMFLEKPEWGRYGEERLNFQIILRRAVIFYLVKKFNNKVTKTFFDILLTPAVTG
jgi:hypothetical protein